MGPDPAYSASPYKGPALDGSDTPRVLSIKLSGPDKLRPGQLGTVSAAVDGGAAPYAYEWSGDHGGSGTSVTVVSRKAGDLKLTLTVRDGAGGSASETITIKADAVNPPIVGMPAEPVYGTSADLSVTLPAGGKFRVVWQSSPELKFDPVESSDGKTRLTFNRAPSDGVKIWTQILDESGQTSGESPQLTSKVKAPAMVLKVPPEAVKLGSEVPVSVELTPAIEASLIGFRWLEPATSFFKQDSGNGSRIAVSPRAVGPLNLLVEAYVPGTEDILGQLKGSITGAGFGLKARVVEPGTRPMIWKEGVGLVPVPKNTYAGDELVTVEVDFEGEAPKGDVRWAWTANEGTTISGSTSRTPTVSRHETGTASLNVTARNADGVQLGATSCSFQVSVPASEVTKALQPSVVIRPENPAPRTGENLELSAEVARGTAPYTYSWSGVTGSGPRVNFKASKPGRTQVSVTVTDAKGKTASASVALEAVLGDKDKARQEAERLAAEAREAARRGDFDAAVRALDAARAASRDAAEIVKAAAREVATAARTAASTAERKRDFDTAEKLYGAAAKADPTDPTAARSIATLATYRQAMEKLRASQRETDTALDTRDLDLASDKLADVRKAESSLPGAQSPETTDLSQKLARAVSAYQTEVGPKRSAVLTAFNGGKYEESKRLLDALVQSRPLRKEDAAWARSLAEQIKQRLRQATTTAQKAEVKSPQDKVSSSSSSTSSVRPVATSSLPAGASIRLSTTSVRATSTVPAMNPVSSLPTSSAMASQDPSSSATKSGGPALISLPQVQGHGGNFSAGLASLWVPSSAAGGDYSRHARMEGGVFVVDVPPGNGWAKAGLISKEPSFIMDDQPLAVKLSLDPDRTSGFGVAFAPGAHQEAWGTNNVWFTWVRPAAQVHSEFWFGNSAEPADGRASDFMAGRAPEELIFVLRPGLAEVHLPDGRVFTMRPSWLRKGTPVYTHVFSHAQLNQLPAKLALRSLTWGPVPSLPAPVQSVPALGIRPLWTGELPPVWTSLQAVGGDFSRFGRVERGQLVVDVPAGNSWGKTGICSPERLFTIGERPVNIVVRFDPARTSGYVVAFAPNMHQDVWGSSNVWFSYTRSSSQVHGDIWFGNSQGDVDQRVTEQVSGVAPYELVFSLSPGRAEVRLPDGRVRVIKSSWLLKDTPVYGHVFTHPNEHHLSSKLALTDFTVGVGEMPARKAPPALATQTDTGLRTLWTGEVGGLWAPLSAAGGDYTKHARLVGKALVVDAPAGNGWAKAGVYTPERILTIGDKPFTVTVRLDPSRSTGYCVAFAPVWHQDVWGAGNAWFSWVSPDSAKENVFGGNSQNADDTRFSGTSPAAAPPGTMQFVFRGGGGGLECRFSDGTVRSHNFSWMKKGTPVYLHIFAHAPAHGLPARMTLLGVEVQSELVWPPVH